VVNSHLHFDHAGNNRAFPKATFIVQADHLAHARGRPNFPAIYWDDPSLTYLPTVGAAQIAKGIAVVPTPGHAPGHQSLVVDLRETGRVILCGDAAGPFVVSTSERAFSQEGGDKLSDSSFFKDAAKSAGMPAATGGFVYLNLKDGIPLAESFAQLAGSGLSPDTIANLRPLRSFLAYATADGGEGSATAFLGIQ